MLLNRYRYLISVAIILIFWKQIKGLLGVSKLPMWASNIVMPVVLVVLMAELLTYVDKALNIGGQGNLGPEFMTNMEQVSGYNNVGAGANNEGSQRIENAEYYRQMNAQIAEVVNPENNDDDDNVWTPDNAGLVESMTGDVDDDVPQLTQADANAATDKINVPKLGSVVAANSVAGDTSDAQNSVACMVGGGQCPLLCSKPNPENPCNLVAPIPGGPWQVQSAEAVATRLATGQYVPARCDIEKMELIRRGAIPQSAQ